MDHQKNLEEIYKSFIQIQRETADWRTQKLAKTLGELCQVMIEHERLLKILEANEQYNLKLFNQESKNSTQKASE
jgi:ribosome-binding protein aMBF1 (putative translation factor)